MSDQDNEKDELYLPKRIDDENFDMNVEDQQAAGDEI